MNKMIKGSLAGAAGVALLMGGFGTYALWSDTETVGASQITAGNLDVAAGEVAWQDAAGQAWAADDLIVPGDVVTRTQSFDFTAHGKNLAGAIRFSPGGTTEPSTGTGDDFTVDVAVTGLAGLSGGGGCWEFSSPNVSETVETVVTYSLTADAQDLQDVTAAIEDSTFTIVQGDTCA